MSSKVLVFVGLLGYATSVLPWTPDPSEQVFADAYQSYFDSLKLHYEVPAGCMGNMKASSDYDGSAIMPRCALAADFNGDGTLDYAALLEYIGAGPRLGNRYLDLIVLFSTEHPDRPQHKIFTNMGSVNDRGDIDTFLSLQPTGEINLPYGVKVLDLPGINLLSTSGKNDDPWAYHTIYWNEQIQQFYSITKDND